MPAVVRAAALIVTPDRRLLLTRREDRAYWVPPGGHLEDGESLPACAAREAREEAGVEVEIGPLVYVWEARPGGRRVVELFFLARPRSDPRALTPWIGDAGPREGRRERRLFAREDLRAVTVFPDALRDAFWERLEEWLERGPIHDPYLGPRATPPRAWGGRGPGGRRGLGLLGRASARAYPAPSPGRS